MGTPTPRPYNLTPAERKEELKMMSSPASWPRWPALPVKQRMTEGFPRCGIIIDRGPLDKPGGDPKPIIYDWNLWTGVPLDETKIIAQYSTFDEMVDAGWVVD